MTAKPKRNVREFGPLALDLGDKTATINGKPAKLSGNEFALLEFLTRHPGKVTTTLAITIALWPGSETGRTTEINNLISTLRRKLDPESGDRSYIGCENTRGFYFDAGARGKA